MSFFYETGVKSKVPQYVRPLATYASAARHSTAPNVYLPFAWHVPPFHKIL
jgi:hypothetical protein